MNSASCQLLNRPPSEGLTIYTELLIFQPVSTKMIAHSQHSIDHDLGYRPLGHGLG